MKTKRLGIYLPLLLLAIAAAVTLRTLALVRRFNFEIGYYDGHSLIFAATVTVITAALIMLSYAFLGSPRSPKMSFGGASCYLPSGAVAVSLVYLAANLAAFAKESKDRIFDGGRVVSVPALLALLSAILAVISLGHFFLNVFYTERRNSARAYFSLATVLLLALYAAMLYFDTALPINSPNKVVDQMALLFAALFFLYETRISLGRGRWRGYVAFGLTASLLTAYSALPSLIVYILRGEIISHSIAETVFTLAVFIFITARMLALATAPEDRASLAVENMDAYAEARADEARRLSDKFSERYATQLSIDDLLTEEPETEPTEEDTNEENTEACGPDEENTDDEENTGN